MVDQLQKGLCIIHLYDVTNANLLKMDALKQFDFSTDVLTMLLLEFSAVAGAVLQP